MHPQPDRIASAPETYRARAQSTAGLLTTAAAAIAAGTVFGGISRIPSSAAMAAVVAIVLLLMSVFCYAWAGQYARRDSVPTNDLEDHIKGLVLSITNRMRVGAAFAVAAALSFVVLIVMTVLEARSTTSVYVLVREDAAASLRPLCNGMDENGALPAVVGSSDVDTYRVSLKLELAPGVCGADKTTIWVPARDIVTMIEVVY